MERRDLLKTGAISGGFISGGLLSILGLTSSKHGDAAAELSQLAEQLDNSDLSTPATMVNMTATVEQSIKRAEEKLQNPETGIERWTADMRRDITGLVAVLPGIEPPASEPEIEREINAIKGALRYYRGLLSVLTASQSLFLSINNTQIQSAQWDNGLPSPVDSQSVTTLENQCVQFSEAEQDIPDSGAIQRLTPDREKVDQELEQLKEGYTHYVRAQTAYLEACQQIKEGAIRWEEDETQAAEGAFSAAITRTKIEIPEHTTSFSLYGEGAGLSEFLTILKQYQSGARSMQNACEASGDRQRDSFNKGIEQITDARGRIMELT